MQLAQIESFTLNVGVFILAPCVADSYLPNVLGKTITGPLIIQNNEDLFKGGFKIEEMQAYKVLNSFYFPEEAPFTLKETAAAFKLPAASLKDVPGLPVKRFRTSPAVGHGADSSVKDAIELSVNEHRGIQQPISIGSTDRMRHMFILGQTGTGKSTLMEYMALQDIHADHGIAVIDPHGEIVDALIGKIPADLAEGGYSPF